MSSPGLPAYPTAQPPAVPAPRPNPAPPPPPVSTAPVGQMPTPFTKGMSPQMAGAQQKVDTAASASQAGYGAAADATRAQGGAEAALAAEQGKAVSGLGASQEQELRKLDQGPFQPKQDTLASMGALFMLVGMAGAFLGGKGSTSAAGNAQAALTGIVQGWKKGTDADFARQKAVFDENTGYLKDQAQKVREIYKEALEEAKSGNLPGAVSNAHQKLIMAGADANAKILESKGLDAGLKAAETNLKTVETLEEKHQALQMHYEQMQQAHQDRMAALGAKAGAFTPEMGAIMAALAAKGISLPTGLRSIQQQGALYRGLLERYPGKSPDEIADLIKGGQIDLKAELKETQVAAAIAGRVGVATAEMDPMGKRVIDAAAKVPRGSFLPVNKLLRMGENQLQDPNLRTLKVNIISLLNAYDVLAARGGTDAAKREEAHSLLTTADSPETLAAGVEAFKQEGAIAEQAAHDATHKYGGGESHENVTEERYKTLKKGEKYWFGGQEYTKE